MQIKALLIELGKQRVEGRERGKEGGHHFRCARLVDSEKGKIQMDCSIEGRGRE